MSDAKDKKNDSVSEIIQKKFLEERKVFLWGEVSDRSARSVTEKLLFLEASDPGKDITFYINTPGGSMTAGMAVYDTMQLISSSITVVVTGMAASMGSILLCGAYELLFNDKTDNPIIINDYIEISKGFYEGREKDMVNAILDNLSKTMA